MQDWIPIVLTSFMLGCVAANIARIAYHKLKTKVGQPTKAPAVTQARMERVHVRVKSPRVFFADKGGSWGNEFSAGAHGETACRQCGGAVSALSGDDQRFTPDMEKGLIGLFCLSCYKGVHVERKNSYSAPLMYLEHLITGYEKRAAFYNLLPQETDQRTAATAFTATVEGTGGLRTPPMRVIVDPETQTVRPVEDETKLAEAEVADQQANEAAKKALTN